MQPAARAALVRMAVDAGRSLHDERIRRGWTLRELAERAGTAVAVAHRVESGDVATLESYARLAVALGLRPELALADPRTRRTTGPTTNAASDFVHAAMGEVEARALARPGRTIAIDEPYQHYQFAGRADVLAWDDANLLHIENRTRFPNLQDAAGAWNAKRQYLARADRRSRRHRAAWVAKRHACHGLPLVIGGAPRDPPPPGVVRGAVPGQPRRVRGLAPRRTTGTGLDQLTHRPGPRGSVRLPSTHGRRHRRTADPRATLPGLRRCRRCAREATVTVSAAG